MWLKKSAGRETVLYQEAVGVSESVPLALELSVYHQFST